MPGSARKPSGTAEKPRQRTLSQVVVRCEIGECPFQAKTTRTVVKHQREAHGIDPKPEDTFDSSVNISVLDDTTFPTANGAAAGDSLDHKSKSDFYQEVSRVQQSTQLETGEKRDRSSDEEEEEEDEKRIRLSATAVTEQSQGEIRRQAVRDRALAIAGNNQREAHDTSENLLESEGQVETGDLFANSDSMLMKTAQETQDQYDYSLSLANPARIEDNEFKDLEDKYKQCDSSLKQALSKVAELEEERCNRVKTIETLENKISRKDEELIVSTDTITQLTTKIEELEKLINSKPDLKAMKKVASLTNKVGNLEKKLGESKDLLIRAQENAEKQCHIAEGFKLAQNELLAQVVTLKRDTLCKDENCQNSKECGRSHIAKQENRGQCSFYNYGKCNKGNSCKFKHDAAAKQKYHEEEEKKKKDEKEKKEEEEKSKKKEDEEKDENTKETAKKGKAKRKRKGKKEKKTEDSTPMEVDKGDDDSLDDSESNPRKKVKPLPKSKPSKPQKPPTNKKEVKGKPSASGQTKTSTQDNPTPDPQPPNNQPPQLTASLPTQPPAEKSTSTTTGIEARTDAGTNLTQSSTPATTFLPNDMSRPPPPHPHNQYRPYMMPQTFNFNPGYGIPANLAPSFQQNVTPGWNNWQGPTVQQVQVQPPPPQYTSRRTRLNNIRSQIASLQGQIIAAQNDPQGSTDISQLVQQEAALKQRLYEHYED